MNVIHPVLTAHSHPSNATASFWCKPQLHALGKLSGTQGKVMILTMSQSVSACITMCILRCMSDMVMLASKHAYMHEHMSWQWPLTRHE